MILKKISAGILLTFCSSLLLYAPSVSTVHAETTAGADESLSLCPIGGNLSAVIIGQEAEQMVGDSWNDYVSITNQSEFTLGGVRIGVAVYQREDDTVPAYFVVLPDELTLRAHELIEIPFSLTTTSVVPGTYAYRVFVIQGNETTLLGHALNTAKKQSAGTLIKQGVASSPVVITAKINDVAVAKGKTVALTLGTPVSASVQTTNKATLPLIDSEIRLVLTEGAVPLGTAVTSEKSDSVRLIPGATRTTEFSERFFVGGRYTLYATLHTANTLQPLVSVPIEFRGTTGNTTFNYVSVIGLSDYPVQRDSSLVACFDVVGGDDGTLAPTDPIALRFVLTDTTGDQVFQQTFGYDEFTGYDFVRVRPNVTLHNFTLYSELLDRRFGDLADSATRPTEDTSSNWVGLQKHTETFACEALDACAEALGKTVNNFVSEQPVRESFWFYAGIVMAAALLMWIMLRRLEPEVRRERIKAPPSELP
ncbi:MAG: hypothetical protein AAB388_03225 [Patescibacteria group bacterium]